MSKHIINLFFINYLFFLYIPLTVYIYIKRNYHKWVYLSIIFLFYLTPIMNYFLAQTNINIRLLLIYYISLTLVLLMIRKYPVEREENKYQDENYLTVEGNTLLKEILHTSFDSKGLGEGGRSICNIVKAHFNIGYCSLFLYSPRDKFNLIASNVEDIFLKDIEEFVNITFENKKEDAFILCSDTYLEYPSAKERHIKYLYFIPLKIQNKINGAILLEDIQRNVLEPQDESLFDIMIENISVVLQNLIYEDKLYAAANLDGLTQVGNRRYMEKILKEQIEQHKSTSSTFSLVIFDIDHFKKFNDNFGHLIGDKALQITSFFIKENIRKDEDEIFRYGGEEFVIFFPNTNNKIIFNKVDTLRKRLSELVINTGIENQTTSITASFGIAEYPRHGKTVKELIKSADKALYHSKENGRNQVTDYSLLEIQKEQID